MNTDDQNYAASGLGDLIARENLRAAEWMQDRLVATCDDATHVAHEAEKSMRALYVQMTHLMTVCGPALVRTLHAYVPNAYEAPALEQEQEAHAAIAPPMHRGSEDDIKRIARQLVRTNDAPAPDHRTFRQRVAG